MKATGRPQIDTAPLARFDGRGGTWSPETLLCASVADCFILLRGTRALEIEIIHASKIRELRGDHYLIAWWRSKRNSATKSPIVAITRNIGPNSQNTSGTATNSDRIPTDIM